MVLAQMAGANLFQQSLFSLITTGKGKDVF
jgi:hypothetical protein